MTIKDIYLRYTLIFMVLLFIGGSCKKDEVIQKNPDKGPVFNSDLIYDSIKDIEGNTYKTITIRV